MTYSAPVQKRVANARPSATLQLNELSAAMQARNETVYRLGFGQSPFPVPNVVVDALRAHAAEKAYLPVRGLQTLREAVATHLRSWQTLDITADDILIGPGTKELMYTLQMTLGATLLLPAPSWVSYAPQAELLGLKVHWIPTSPSQGWRLTPAALADACRKVTGPKLLVLNSPGNPTGTCHGDSELRALAAVCADHELLVLSDEIYGRLHHDDAHVSMARFLPRQTVVASGLSKWCGAGGWRLGWLAIPPQQAHLLSAMARVASETWSCASAPVQHAAVVAYTPSPAIEQYLQRSRTVVRAVAQAVAARLGDATPSPQGGFYLFPEFSGHVDRLARRGIHDSPTLAATLLQETGVATLPGTAFGLAPDRLALRLALVDFDGTAALSLAAQHSGEALAEACAPRVLTATDLTMNWLAT